MSMSNKKLAKVLGLDNDITYTDPFVMRTAMSRINEMRNHAKNLKEFKALADWLEFNPSNPLDLMEHAVGVLGNQKRLIDEADNTHAAICDENDKLEAKLKERDEFIAQAKSDAESDALKYDALAAQCEPLANLICGGGSCNGIQDVTALVSMAIDHINKKNEYVESLRDELVEAVDAIPERREWDGVEPLFVGAIVRGGYVVEAVSTNVHRQVCLRHLETDNLQIMIGREVRPVKDDADRVTLEYLSSCDTGVPRDMASRLRELAELGLITLNPDGVKADGTQES